MILLRIFFPLFLFTSAIKANAQAGVTVKASVDKNKILIGEPMQLTLEAKFPYAAKTSFYTVDSFSHFEFLKPAQIDSGTDGKIKTIKVVYTLTSFDSGHWVIPSFVLNKKVKSDIIPVDVVFAEFNPEQDYHDLKDIVEIKPKEKTKDWLWYAAAGTVLTLLLIYFLLRKKKGPVAITAPPLLNAYEEAMKQLKNLQKENLAGKEYHTKLVDIFRLYIFRKKNILSLQKTTDDLVMQLRNSIADRENYRQLQQSLQLSDFVKFAKYNPSADDSKLAYETILKTIKTIEQSGSDSSPAGE